MLFRQRWGKYDETDWAISVYVTHVLMQFWICKGYFGQHNLVHNIIPTTKNEPNQKKIMSSIK